MSKIHVYGLGILAYVIWGLSPIYFKSIESLSADEIIVHRIVWSAVCCGIFLFFIKDRHNWQALFSHPKYVIVLFGTGFLVSGNWLLYVWAINNHYILEASLGYYINPLVSVMLGAIILKEKMRKLQWIAVGLAVTGVFIQIIILGYLPWISLLLAFSFSIYGLIRKILPVKAFQGMLVETWILTPFALWWLWQHPELDTMTASFWQGKMIWLAMLAGPLTLVPLLLFNIAAKNLPYSSIGFLQYIYPTLVFLLAIFYFNEDFSFNKIIIFCFIWIALIIFSIDTYLTTKRAK